MTPTPDHVPCRHCGKPISWDEICWVHDDTGFSTCDTVIAGGEPIQVGAVSALVNPEVKVEGPNAGKVALPVGDWE